MKMSTKTAPKASEKPVQQANSTRTEPVQQANTPKRKPPKRNRSIKRRPEDVPGLIVALKEDVLDIRTREAQDVLALRDSLAKEPKPVAMGLIRDALALDGVIMSRIAAELVKPGANILDEFGQLHPLLTKFWPEIRDGVFKGTKALLAMEPKADKVKDEADAEAMLDLTTILISEAKGDEDNR